jgi:ribose 5-phosphate isomerase A
MSEIWAAAIEAADRVESDMVVGLGTGRAAAMFVRALARRIEGGLTIRGVPTSVKTAELARELSVPLTTLDAIERIDLDVDGADEVDPELDLIKGHGGALLRERVVASISTTFMVIVGEEKLVPRLGAKMSVPVEVVPFAVPVVRARLLNLGATVELRKEESEPFESDNGNHILDATFARIDNPVDLEQRIDAIAGVVDNGLFIGMADGVLVQGDQGFREMKRA